MQMHLQAIGNELWYIVENGIPSVTPTISATDVNKFKQLDSQAKNIIDVSCASLATAVGIVVSMTPGILLLRLRLKGLPRKVCKGFPPWPWSHALVFPRSGKGDVAQRW